MRNCFLVLLFCISTISCKKAIVSSPENLFDEQTMVDILYDLALLEAIQAVNPSEFDVSSIKPLEFIYEKYSIDSVSLYQNNAYYASNPEKYSVIHQNIAEKLALIETEKDTLISKQKNLVQEKILSKTLLDSIKALD